MSRRGEAIESRPFYLAGIALVCAICAQPLLAEIGDRNKPVNIEADRVNIDDAKQVSVFDGNVRLTQGTLAIRADKIIIKQDDAGFQHGTAYGSPVAFKQKREGSNDYVEGYGERVEYDGKTDKIEFFTRARVKRGDDEVRGNYISYDAVSESYQVVGGGKPAATATNPDGRVRAVIQPKKKSDAGSRAPSVPLKPADSIANPRER